ncbi:hypothetical protein B1C78_10745 [Thioalkalivibrio denitrificans]|uniref:Capsular biosynthesis protein n=1 Tax=Thioalkalivibrio denitrificans TaxID=108003 RepID=A0A1V3NFE4_9GAMM|nr:Stealth CR1 domain-containing protein [Thioalkalivibrio denitrificans]OOG23598.1 hypothetical protein B1C78_10745 [Thioalkalivibrio denitrificans]
MDIDCVTLQRRSSMPVDVVITWVDGNDPVHQARRAEALRRYGDTSRAIPAGRSTIRFSDNGELELALKSIRRNAPWVRAIHIVVDGQKPSFLTPTLQDQMGIRVVDHREIFRGYEWALPTFNSRTIETAIWRIDGLAENFLYMNDDFLILRPVDPTDFFREGKVVLRGRWRPIRMRSWPVFWLETQFNRMLEAATGISRTMSLQAQMRGAALAGFRARYYRSPHVPHPIRKSTLSEFFSKNPKVFEDNIHARFRDARQFVSTFLAHHLEIRKDRAWLVRDSESWVLNGELFGRGARKRVSVLGENPPKFLCLQNLEKLSVNDRSVLIRRLETLVDAPVAGNTK